MSGQYDFKKELEKTKSQLIKFSKEAIEIAKKGEEEILKFSKRGKLHVDATAVNLKKEKLLYLIGKEYVEKKFPEKPTGKLKTLVDEFGEISKEQKSIKRKLKTKSKNAKK